MIVVRCPPTYTAEREYVLGVVLGEFLGVPWRLVSEERTDMELTLDSDPSGPTLSLADVLFQTPPTVWLSAGSMPARPLGRWRLPAELAQGARLPAELPVLYGKESGPHGYLHLAGRQADLGLDVLGSVFFMLTRYEELAADTRDAYGRFPARASLAYQEGYIGRPLVDEYVEVLWAVLSWLWPGLKRRQRQFSVWPTHDIDAPFGIAGQSLPHVAKNLAGDLLARRSMELARRRLRSLLAVRRGDVDEDINNTFSLMMDLSEQHGLRSTFNILVDERESLLRNPWVQGLMQRIHERGHELGVHPGFGTLQNPERVKEAADAMRQTMVAVGIAQDGLGGRQHFLQWDCPSTWQAYADAGLAYDSSVGFADHAGFRAGTCHEYPAFNVLTRELLALRERPLVVMDTSLLRYQRLGCAEAADRIAALRRQCQLHRGVFAVLWHNTTMVLPAHAELYRQALAS